MKIIWTLIVLCIAVFAVLTVPRWVALAHAGTVKKVAPHGATPAPAIKCGPVKLALSALKERFGESPALTGLISEKQMLLILENPDTKSWTELLVTADGMACMLASGTDFTLSIPGQPS